jgi:hypothetical protein
LNSSVIQPYAAKGNHDPLQFALTLPLARRKANIETYPVRIQHLQHQKLMFATSKILDIILKHSHGTLATCREPGCNLCTTICNINENRLHHEGDRLQHAKNIVTTPVYNNCNIWVRERRPALGCARRRGAGAPPSMVDRHPDRAPGHGGASSAFCRMSTPPPPPHTRSAREMSPE